MNTLQHALICQALQAIFNAGAYAREQLDEEMDKALRDAYQCVLSQLLRITRVSPAQEATDE